MKLSIIFLFLISFNYASLILMNLRNPNTKYFPKFNYKNINNINYPIYNFKTNKSFKIKKSLKIKKLRSAILYQKLYNVFKYHADYTYSMASYPLSYSFKKKGLSSGSTNGSGIHVLNPPTSLTKGEYLCLFLLLLL